MRHVGFVLLGVMAAAVVACAAGNGPTSQGSSDITETDAAAPPSSSSDASASTDASTDAGSAADASTPATPTWDEVAPLLQSACGGCHHDQFSDQETVDGNAASMLSMINRGRMPKGNPTWKNTPDGQKVIAYLTSVE